MAGLMVGRLAEMRDARSANGMAEMKDGGMAELKVVMRVV